MNSALTWGMKNRERLTNRNPWRPAAPKKMAQLDGRSARQRASSVWIASIAFGTAAATDAAATVGEGSVSAPEVEAPAAGDVEDLHGRLARISERLSALERRLAAMDTRRART